ncbi:MAG: hypothetical protein K2P00_04980 [Alistipes sp.]|nr:hypothetical protein [Alistipes sp.]
MDNKTITLKPFDDTSAELLQTATIRTAEQLNRHNPTQAAILRRMAMNLDSPSHDIGELTIVSAFLLQLSVQQFAAQVTDKNHAARLYEIAQDITDKIHAHKNQEPCD